MAGCGDYDRFDWVYRSRDPIIVADVLPPRRSISEARLSRHAVTM